MFRLLPRVNVSFKRLVTGVTLGGVCVVAVLFGSVAAASALTVMSRSPMYGATFATSTVSFDVYVQEAPASGIVFDPSNPNTTILVDGVPVLSVVTGLLPYRIRIQATVTGLSDGSHTYAFRTQNTAGGTVTGAPFSFTIQAPPWAADFAPYPGTAALQPSIRARVVDNSGGTLSVVMSLNGAPVPSTYDQVTRIVSYTPTSPLTDNTLHFVSLNMVDSNGFASTASWSFMVDSSATVSFYDHSPAPGSTTSNGSPPILVTATSSIQLLPSSVELYIDGASYTPTVVENSPNILEISTAGSTLDDGAHTVRVVVHDGLAFEETWSFSVGAPPDLSALTPADGSSVMNPRPPVGLTVADNSPGNLDVRLTFDGTVVLDEGTPQGDVLWTPPGDLPAGSTHSVSARVADAQGNESNASWTFTVIAQPPMTSSCVDCHTSYPVPSHSVNTGGYECASLCHGSPHGDPPPPSPLGIPACTGCHGDQYDGTPPWSDAHDASALNAVSCETCHSETWPAIPQHTSSEVTATHAASIAPDCALCHVPNLVTEHGRYPTGSDHKFQCTVCHSSTDPQVVDAIANGETDCESCHGAVSHASSHDGGLAGHSSCTSCHQDNISAQHGNDCELCHGSSDDRVLDAIEAGDTSCDACHDFDADHGSAVHNGGFDLTDECVLCHSSNIAQEHGNDCDRCHESTDPTVVAAIAAQNTSCGACHGTYHGYSPVFYFDFKPGNEVVEGADFQRVFPASWNTTFTIDNGAGSDAVIHGSYSQSSAKCGACHAVHRAPTAGTSGYSTRDLGGTGQSASRYSSSAWTAQATTELLLKSTANNACSYCHISSGPTKMYGGDATLALFGSGENSWNEFYGHTTGCTSCHAVHGAYTFKGPDTARTVLKYQGVKKLGNIPLVVQPEVYTDSPLYANQADMIAGVVKPAALADGVTAREAAISAQCTVCHANYSPASNQVINPTYVNPVLFQPGSWASANGSVATFTANAPVTALPGSPGIVYTGTGDGAPASLAMAYKNHPMKKADAVFNGAGASAGVKGLVPVTDTSSYTCLSCHNADRIVDDTNGADAGGEYLISSFPHYTPGYYKFMKAQDQSRFDTPATLAELLLGRHGFFESGFGTARAGKPAVMNDGYCIKCHDKVGTEF